MQRLNEDECRQIVREAFADTKHLGEETQIDVATARILREDLRTQVPSDNLEAAWLRILRGVAITSKPRLESARSRAFKYAKDMGLLTVDIPLVKDWSNFERECADILRRAVDDGVTTCDDLASSIATLLRTGDKDESTVIAKDRIIHRRAKEDHTHPNVVRWHCHKSNGTPEAVFVPVKLFGTEGKGATTATGRKTEQKPNWQNAAPPRYTGRLSQELRDFTKTAAFAAAYGARAVNFPIQVAPAFPWMLGDYVDGATHRPPEQRPHPPCFGCTIRSQYRSAHTNAFCRWTIDDMRPPCSRCKGTGRVPYTYKDGVCFKCSGRGHGI